jgi:uncharacterized protein (TIGR03083 family)
VPTCPGWQVRDLVRHVGGVHRWAASFVRDGRTDPADPPELSFFAEPPADETLLDWFREGHAALVAALGAADPAVKCWTFMPAPSPLAFWARRQAHETAVHRVDAQSAAGAVTEVPADLAADGCAELLEGFVVRRPRRFTADPPVAIAFEITAAARPAGAPPGSGARDTGRNTGRNPAASDDAGQAWTVRIGPDGMRTAAGRHDADLLLRGPAPALYLALWNRAGLDGLEVVGDAAVWELWRARMRVTW